jgi:hypothetical protein
LPDHAAYEWGTLTYRASLTLNGVFSQGMSRRFYLVSLSNGGIVFVLMKYPSFISRVSYSLIRYRARISWQRQYPSCLSSGCDFDRRFSRIDAASWLRYSRIVHHGGNYLIWSRSCSQQFTRITDHVVNNHESERKFTEQSYQQEVSCELLHFLKFTYDSSLHGFSAVFSMFRTYRVCQFSRSTLINTLPFAIFVSIRFVRNYTLLWSDWWYKSLLKVSSPVLRHYSR